VKELLGGLAGELTLAHRIRWAFEAIDRATKEVQSLADGKMQHSRQKYERIRSALHECREVLLEMRGAVEAYRECAITGQPPRAVDEDGNGSAPHPHQELKG
jgi:ABC-type transporter lipoprotein component MlaA